MLCHSDSIASRESKNNLLFKAGRQIEIQKGDCDSLVVSRNNIGTGFVCLGGGS